MGVYALQYCWVEASIDMNSSIDPEKSENWASSSR